MKDLLRSWLTDRSGRLGVADLLDAVNKELLDLVGEHLLIGPSHFMKTDLSDRALERIWTYNIFPLIEEQFWGRPDRDRSVALGPGEEKVRRHLGQDLRRRRPTVMSLAPPDQPVVLTEYGEGQIELTAAQERTLRRLAQRRLTILPGDALNSWRVKASSYVGTIVTPDVRILIKPKSRPPTCSTCLKPEACRSTSVRPPSITRRPAISSRLSPRSTPGTWKPP